MRRPHRTVLLTLIAILLLSLVPMGPLASPAEAQSDALYGPFMSQAFGAGDEATQAMALGDLDGDSDLDAVVANVGQAPRFYLNDGRGSFLAGVPFGSPGAQATGVALGDVDGDGDLDIALAQLLGQSVVYLNSGAAGFYSGPPTCDRDAAVRCFGGPADTTLNIAFGDVNGDGSLDLVAARYTSGNVVFPNNGDGTFGPEQLLPGLIPGQPATLARAVALGDLNGDGALDIVLGNDAPFPDLYLLNDGQGDFGAPLLVGVEANNTAALALGDLNGDGLLDIVTGGLRTQLIYFAQDFGFAPAISVVNTAFADIRSIALGDVDADGDLDLFSVSFANSPALLFNSGTGEFGQVAGVLFTSPLPATAAAIGDLDGNGYLDLVIGNENLPHTRYLNGGARLQDFGRPATAVPFGSGTITTFDLAHGDFDGDGLVDLVVASIGQSFVYLNRGDSAFSTEPVVCGQTEGVRCFGPAAGGSGLVSGSVAVSDVNRDGAPDIIASSTNQNAVYLNDGAGNFEFRSPACSARVLCFGSRAFELAPVAAADVNGDTYPDVVLGSTTGQSAVFLNRPNLALQSGEQTRFFAGPFECGTIPAVRCVGEAGSGIESITTGDINGDGAPDIVMPIPNGGSRAYFNDGAGGFAFGQRACSDAQALTCFGNDLVFTLDVAVADLDADGRQDLVVVARDSTDLIFYNRPGPAGGIAWEQAALGAPFSSSSSVEIGDLDGDGDGDIVVGTARIQGQQKFSAIFFNQSGAFFSGALNCATPGSEYRCFGSGDEPVTGITLANFDADTGAGLDIAYARLDQQTQVLLNEGGLFRTLRPVGTGGDLLGSISVGDVNGDGAQDVLIGSFSPLGRSGVSYADGRGGFTATRPFGGPATIVESALGDLDGDGDLDAALADRFGQSLVYLNQGGRFAAGPVGCDVVAAVRCFGAANAQTPSIALGDVNGDGALDIAAAIRDGQSRIFLNDGQGNFSQESLIGPPVGAAWSIALGDMDRDGDLDAVIGAESGFNAVYLNDGAGTFPNGAVDCATAGVRCFGVATFAMYDLALGDVSGDGALDIAMANNGRQSLAYLNDGRGGFATGEVPCSNAQVRCFGAGERTFDVALGDLDGDGDLDVVTANLNQHNRVFLNADGVFAPVRGLEFSRNVNETIAVADADDDGSLDIVSGSPFSQNVVYRNLRLRAPALPSRPVRIVAARPGSAPAAADGASPEVLTDSLIPVRFRLFGLDGGPVSQVRAFFSLDGGGAWQPAVPAAGTRTTNLAASPTGTEHTFTWDTFASGVFGQSDRVVLRFVAANGPAAAAYGPPGSVSYPRQTPGPFQYPASTTETTPFRVRGTQVRVSLANGQPAPGALVYRLPAGESRGGTTLSAASGEAFRTTALGALPGRGELQLGDRLVALYPITATGTFSMYLTSAAPTAAGLDATSVMTSGIQSLTVRPSNPLVLLNLELSLEWDAREDGIFIEQLRFDLQRTSELLYDWSDGQFALGAIRIFHGRERWDEAHIRVYATNSLRPNANQGGIVAEPLADPDRASIVYEPGQVRMGVVWNRYGEAGGSLGEDWPRTLAHELGHFALYLDDNYLGLDEQGRLISVSACRGAMSDPYRNDYGEFHPAGAEWDTNCRSTLSQRSTGRADWQTIGRFYDRPELGVALNRPTQFGANPGPGLLPLAVTTITEMPLAAAPETLDVPIFAVTQGGARALPGPTTRVFLFPREGDRMIDLGQPVLDQVTARGARPGDRLCLYESAASRLGCETISEGDDTLELSALTSGAWSPDIRVTPVTSRTVDLAVGNLPAGLSLRARLFSSATPAGQAPPEIGLTATGDGYSGRFSLTEPALDGFVQVWAEGGPLRESVTDYALGGNPGVRRSRNAPRGNPGVRRSRNAPAVSADGQVILFSDNLRFDPGEFFSVQPATRLPQPPPGRTLVGRGYWLSASSGAPDLAGVAINIGYLGREAPPGAEDGIRVYFWDGTAWQALDTAVDAVRNEASAVGRGAGLYALMASVEIPLAGPGWNLIAYPVRATLPVGEALSSIEGSYTLVYGYAAADERDPWRVYAPGAPEWVSDLGSLEFGQGYWINASADTTLFLPVGAAISAAAAQTSAAVSLPAPPATYYGAAPAADLEVRAYVGGVLCGQARTQAQQLGGTVRPVFVVKVRAAGQGADAECGTPGAAVVITIGDATNPTATITTRWDNSAVREVGQQSLYLPLIRR